MNEFFILTIEGRRRITNLLALVSTGVYSVAIPGFNFKDLSVDGVLGTEVFSPITNGNTLYDYYFDIENQTLQVRLNASDITSMKDFIITHIIALTNDKDMYWNIDPDDEDSRLIAFESRLRSRSINFSQQQENNIVGILTTSLTSINVENADQFINKFISKYDSFKDSPVKIWKCHKSPSDRSPYYKGYVSRITSNDVSVITINDFFKVLDTPYYSRGTKHLSSSKSLTGTFPDTSDKPIVRAVGRNSFFKWREVNISSGFFTSIEMDTGSMPQAVCNTYNPALGTSANRGWLTGIIDGASDGLDGYIINSATNIGYETWLIELDSGYDDLTIGDTFVIARSGTQRYSGYVYGYGSNQNSYVMKIGVGIGVPTSGDALILWKVSCLILSVDGNEYMLNVEVHYRVSSFSVNEPIPITLFNNIEGALGITRPIDPTKDKIYYKLRNVSNQSNQNHGQMVKNILLSEFDVSEIDTVSFDDADLILDLQLNYQVPLSGDQWPTKKEILQMLLSSSLGYLYLNNEFKIAYGVYTESADDDETTQISDIEIEKGTMSHEVDYEDCFASVDFVNEYFGVGVGTRINITDESARALHRSEKVFDIVTLTEVQSKKIIDLFSGHLKRVAGFLTNPKIKTRLSSLDYRAFIGEKKTFKSLKALSYNNATVVSTGESIMRQDVTVINLNEMEGKAFVSVNGSEPEEI